MVQLTIQVRAKTCYSNAGKIKTLSVDSSQRVEEIVERGSRLYRNGHELPLNSSFASNNVQNGDILESCSSPLMSALLSAVLKDLNDVQKVPEPERTKEKLEPLLGGAKLEPWSNRWNTESIKSRIICLAMMKKVIQRDERFANETVPEILTLQELYNFMQPQWNKNRGPGGGGGHNSMAHVFKPSAKNANGKPSTIWQMMEHKLVMAQRIRRACATTGEDWIEVFVKNESNRHKTANTAASTPSSRSRSSRRINNATPQQPRRTLSTPGSSSSTTRRGASSVAVQCATDGCHQLAEYTCLEANCPFHEQLTCTMCFLGNHPVHIRNHTRIPLTDPRVKAILKEKNKKGYCPEFQSGPYAILCCLLEASLEQHGDGRRELSLSESKLKKLAQRRCRSNLYDRQARGRSAFACIEGMADKQLVRKELIPNQEEARFSLMPEGEAMAKRCLDFDTVVNQVLKDSTMTKLQAPCPKNLTLLVDTREDATYSNRLQESCFDDGYPCEPRELPAGDYLFTQKKAGGDTDNEVVMPLVIERKSWSDFADSVHGAGRGQKRLDCVKIGGTGQCPNGRCQLCRMKRSGCEKVMFIIEGARCLNRDGEEKCSNAKRCQHCRELQERHNTIQEDLESIIYDLQVTHGCLIHFTRNYNDTIQSLKIIYRLLASEHSGRVAVQQDDDLQRAIQLSLGTAAAAPPSTSITPNLTYKAFASNARKYKTRPQLQNGSKKKDVQRLGTETFVRGICDDNLLAAISTGARTSATSGQQNLNKSFDEAAAAVAQPTIELIDSDSDDDYAFPESQNSVEILEVLPAKPAARASKHSTPLDSDSDDSLDKYQESGLSRGTRERKRAKSGAKSDDVQVIEKNVGNHGTAPGIFVVTGLYEYDRDFFKDVNKIWQNMYRTNSNSSRDNFRKSVSDQLRAIQKDQLPLAHRDSILYWTLRIPLCENVLLHTARISHCVDALQSRWDNERPFPSSGGRTLGTADSGNNNPRERRKGVTREQQVDDIVVLDGGEGAPSGRRDLLGNSSRIQDESPVVNKRSTAKRKRDNQTTPIYTVGDDDDDELTVLGTLTPGVTTRTETSTPRLASGISQKQTTSSRGKPPRPARKAPPAYAIDPPIEGRNVGSGRRTTTPDLEIEYAGTSSPSKAAAKPVAPTPPVSTRKPPPSYSADTNVASRNVLPDSSLSNTDAAVREARLRRFGVSKESRKRSRSNPTPSTWRCETCTFAENPLQLTSCEMCSTDRSLVKPSPQRVSDPSPTRPRSCSTPCTWRCGECTFENPLHSSSCEICGTDNSTPPRPQRASTPPHNRPRPRSTPSTWRCVKCTYENPLHSPSCEMCGADNSFNDDIRPETKGSSDAAKPDMYSSGSSLSSTKRRIRCGACGLEGHNRGTATSSNCPAYNRPEEIHKRNMKKEAAKKKAKDAAESFKDFESRKEARDAAREQRNQEMQRLIALQQQDAEEDRRNSENELKRRKKAAERAEKRARRLDR